MALFNPTRGFSSAADHAIGAQAQIAAPPAPVRNAPSADMSAATESIAERLLNHGTDGLRGLPIPDLWQRAIALVQGDSLAQNCLRMHEVVKVALQNGWYALRATTPRDEILMRVSRQVSFLVMKTNHHYHPTGFRAKIEVCDRVVLMNWTDQEAHLARTPGEYPYEIQLPGFCGPLPQTGDSEFVFLTSRLATGGKCKCPTPHISAHIIFAALNDFGASEVQLLDFDPNEIRPQMVVRETFDDFYGLLRTSMSDLLSFIFQSRLYVTQDGLSDEGHILTLCTEGFTVLPQVLKAFSTTTDLMLYARANGNRITLYAPKTEQVPAKYFLVEPEKGTRVGHFDSYRATFSKAASTQIEDTVLVVDERSATVGNVMYHRRPYSAILSLIHRFVLGEAEVSPMNLPPSLITVERARKRAEVLTTTLLPSLPIVLNPLIFIYDRCLIPPQMNAKELISII